MDESNPTLEQITHRIELAILDAISECATEPCSVIHYGANDIDPKHLVFWIVVESDWQKRRLEADTELMTRLRGLLDRFAYPQEGRDHVHIGFESKETVDRESAGDFRQHWK